MKNFKFLFYILFLWVPITFAEYPVDLYGEWTRTCIKRQFKEISYYTTKIAFFDENKYIISWKLYDDPVCTKLRGEYWEKWQITFEDSYSDESDIFHITHTPTDGRGGQCTKLLDILMLATDNTLYFGMVEEETYCKESPPVELQKTPYTFSRSVDQTIEEYVESLQRYWIEDVEDGSRRHNFLL